MGGHAVISPSERLALTIRFLATGESYSSLSYQFRISQSAISYIIQEVCKAIFKLLGPLYMKVPSTEEEWLAIAKHFEQRWQFPNALGAVNGKHITMQPPTDGGSYYYNYKHSHSIILMAIAGPDYECIYADIGTNGRVNDAGVWNKCSISTAIDDNTLSIPSPRPLPFGMEKMPFVFLGDDAFALKSYMMKPFPQQGLTLDKRIYNYRHSRGRRISENLFGILANRWRVFLTTMSVPPESIENIVLAALVLHNFLRKSSSKSVYCPIGLIDSEDGNGNIVPGTWREKQMIPLQVPSTGHNSTSNAKRVREAFKDYFMSEGAVEWQWDKC